MEKVLQVGIDLGRNLSRAKIFRQAREDNFMISLGLRGGGVPSCEI